MSSDCYSQLKGPLLLNGEEEPNDNPEEQVEDGADDTGQHSTIKAALVDKGIVVKQRPIAHWNKMKKYEITRKYPLCGYILGALPHTTTCN